MLRRHRPWHRSASVRVGVTILGLCACAFSWLESALTRGYSKVAEPECLTLFILSARESSLVVNAGVGSNMSSRASRHQGNISTT
ncbi:hypothetical protein LIA77_11553 [Sarocladium implicatum]|nr:hypothetical protein LIA77_11553 [Sarocladium implicatum]